MMTRSFYRLIPTHLSLLRKAVVVSRQFVLRLILGFSLAYSYH